MSTMKKRESAVPGTVVGSSQTIDLAAVKLSVLNRANDAVPLRIKRMTKGECLVEVRSKLKARAAEEFSGKDWAVRILTRQADGEYLPIISIDKAREAMGYSIERTPGEDG